MKEKEQAANANYKLLLDCAQALIAEQGCRATTLQRIMERSGLSKGAIYHYVKSKEELFGKLLASQLDEVNEAFEKAVADNGNLDGPLRAIAEGLSALQKEDSIANRVLTYLISQREKDGIAAVLQTYHRRCAELACGWIEEGQAAGVIRQELDAAKTAEGFVIMAYGMCMRNLMKADGETEPSSGSFGMEDYYAHMLEVLKG